MPQFLVIFGFAAMGAIIGTSLISSTKEQLTAVLRVQNRQEGFYNGELAAWVAYLNPTKSDSQTNLGRETASFSIPVIGTTVDAAMKEYNSSTVATGTPIRFNVTAQLDSSKAILNRLPDVTYAVQGAKTSSPLYIGQSSAFARYQSKVMLAGARSTRSLVFQPGDMAKKPPVKVVFVVDDSRSMGEEQAKLASATAPMLDALRNIGLNAQLYLYSTTSAREISTGDDFYQNASLVNEQGYFTSAYTQTSSQPASFPFYDYTQRYLKGPLFIPPMSGSCEIRIDSPFIPVNTTSATLTYVVRGVSDPKLASTVTITNQAGALLLTKSISGMNSSFGLYTGAEGTYTVKATTANGLSCTATYKVGDELSCYIPTIASVSTNQTVNISVRSEEDITGRIASLTITAPNGSVVYNGAASSSNTKSFSGNTSSGIYKVRATFNNVNYCTREYRVGSVASTSGAPACSITLDTDRVIVGASFATMTVKYSGTITGSVSVRIKEDTTAVNPEFSSQSLTSSSTVVSLLSGDNSRYLITGTIRDSGGKTVATCTGEYTAVYSGTPDGCYIPPVAQQKANSSVSYSVRQLGGSSKYFDVTVTFGANRIARDMLGSAVTGSFKTTSEGIYTIKAYSDANYPCYRDVQVGSNSYVAITDFTREPLTFLSSAPDADYTSLRNQVSSSITNLGVTGADTESGLDPIAWLLTENRKPTAQINPGDLAIFFVISDADNPSTLPDKTRLELLKFTGLNTTTTATSQQVGYSVGLSITGSMTTRLNYSYSTTCRDSETGATWACSKSGSFSDFSPSTYGYTACSASSPSISSSGCTSQAISMIGSGYSGYSCSYSCTYTASQTSSASYGDAASNAMDRDLCSSPINGYPNIGAALAASACSGKPCTATATSCTRSLSGGGTVTRSNLIEGTVAPAEFKTVTTALNGVPSPFSENNQTVSQVLSGNSLSSYRAPLSDLKKYADAKLGSENYWFTFIVHDSATEKSLGISCNTGETEAVNYVNFAKSLPAGHVSIYPICAADYRPAVLDKTITPVINAVARVFSAALSAGEAIDKVVIQRANGTEVQLTALQYSVNSGNGSTTVTVDPSVSLSSTDRVVIVIRG